jgi:two-component system cell cycle response regulator
MKKRGQKILVVDDDQENLRIVSRTLAHEGYQVETAQSGADGLKKIDSFGPDLVLLDINMPGMSGLETLKILRSRESYVSIMFLTAKSDTQDVIEGLDAGADDYICKPFVLTEFLARVRAQLRIKALHDELQVANGKLLELVDIDDLTGLFNMRSIYQKLDYELERAKRYNTSLAVVMMDMDNFKHVNDGHDHLFGSWVLSEVGRIIKNNIRSVDFAARYGGDEFLIVLTHTDGAGAKAFSERLRTTIEKHNFVHGPDSSRLTASLGMAYAENGQFDLDAREMVRIADNALYLAKQSGRNRVESVNIQAAPSDPRTLRRYS